MPLTLDSSPSWQMTRSDTHHATADPSACNETAGTRGIANIARMPEQIAIKLNGHNAVHDVQRHIRYMQLDFPRFPREQSKEGHEECDNIYGGKDANHCRYIVAVHIGLSEG